MSKQAESPRVRLGYGGGPLTGESAATLRQTIRRLLGYARPYTLRLVIIALLVIIGTICTLVGPILIGVAIDKAIIPGDGPYLMQLAGILLAVYLIGGVAAVIYGILMVGVGQRLVADIREELFSHLQRLSSGHSTGSGGGACAQASALPRT